MDSSPEVAGTRNIFPCIVLAVGELVVALCSDYMRQVVDSCSRYLAGIAVAGIAVAVAVDIVVVLVAGIVGIDRNYTAGCFEETRSCCRCHNKVLEHRLACSKKLLPRRLPTSLI